MPIVIEVALGDCCSSLAAANGFADYKKIYDAGANAALKANRPNPNTLVVGDSITIPDKDKKSAPANTGTSAKFQLKPGTAKLRIALLDGTDKPLAAKSWHLTIGAKKLAGANVEVAIDPKATAATLEVDLGPRPAPPAPPAPHLRRALPPTRRTSSPPTTRMRRTTPTWGRTNGRSCGT